MDDGSLTRPSRSDDRDPKADGQRDTAQVTDAGAAARKDGQAPGPSDHAAAAERRRQRHIANKKLREAGSPAAADVESAPASAPAGKPSPDPKPAAPESQSAPGPEAPPSAPKPKSDAPPPTAKPKPAKAEAKEPPAKASEAKPAKPAPAKPAGKDAGKDAAKEVATDKKSATEKPGDRGTVVALRSETRPGPAPKNTVSRFDPDDDDDDAPARAKPVDAQKTHVWTVPDPELLKRVRGRQWRGVVTLLSFLVLVILPTLVVGYYYFFLASDQYVVESQFSVRGSDGTSSLAELGLSVIPGATAQNNDSYVVVGYIDSRQVVRDILEKKGVDLRQFYARPEIDDLYRVEPNIPLEQFEPYWRRMVAVEYNSTTGNSTLVVTAFDPGDARYISELIIDVSQELVNELSAESRRQMISVAREEVTRAEERLATVRDQMMSLRNREQAVDPSQLAAIETSVVSGLEQQLAQLKTRQRAMQGTISPDSPSARVIDRQINALQSQLDEQRNRIGSGSGAGAGDGGANVLSSVVNEYTALTVDQEFATTAYTTALGSLEKAMADARQQQRYFATYVYPYTPDATIFPQRMLMTMLAFGALCLGWIIAYYMIRSVYDHAI